MNTPVENRENADKRGTVRVGVEASGHMRGVRVAKF